YVVVSPEWHNGSGAVGAATWGNGTTGVNGAVSATNSLVSSGSNELAGGGVTVLANGNYVVVSPGWNGNTGAVTWGSATTGVSGVISPINSLVGSTSGDKVGGGGVTPPGPPGSKPIGCVALTNGNYVVLSKNWSNEDAVGGVGAVTWGNGTTGTMGTISSA